LQFVTESLLATNPGVWHKLVFDLSKITGTLERDRPGVVRADTLRTLIKIKKMARCNCTLVSIDPKADIDS